MRAGVPVAAAMLAAAMLAGCAGVRPVVEPATAADTCEATRVAAFVGQPMTTTLVEAARTASGAKAVRTIRPGMMVTMDYRADRLNLTVDDKGVVTAIRCG